MFLKFGSGLFLLFFALFAPATPIIAQFGSMMFLLLVFCLSPFLPEKPHSAQVAAPENDQAYYWHIEDDIAAGKLVRQRPQQQVFQPIGSSTAINMPEQKTLEPHLFSPAKPDFFIGKPEKWRIICQPMRAGPLTFFS